MKQKSSSFLLALLLSMATNVANAYDAEIDGIYYNFSGDEATVTYREEWSISYSGTVVIPGSVTYSDNTYNVTSIGGNAFYGCTGLTSITIPNSVTSIGGSAFYYCSSLTSVVIPNSVTDIGNSAFRSCTGLTSITIGSAVTSIGEQAFYCCRNLTEVTIPNSVLTIKKGAFQDCSGLTSLSIGNSVTTIGQEAFMNCRGLTSVTIPNSVTTIGNKAFQACENMTSLSIGNSVASIGNLAFDDCICLTSLTIPASVTSIGSSAFRACTGALNSIEVEAGNVNYDSRNDCNAIIRTATNELILGCKNTIIPNSVTAIGASAFYWCYDLTSIVIPNSITSIGNFAFAVCRGLTSITISNNITTIGVSTFQQCSSLTSITIPDGVTTIENVAFASCTSLTSVSIPESVTSIGSGVFTNCPALTMVKVNQETPLTIYSDCFGNSANAALYVPYGSKSAYEAADYWTDFKEIVETNTVNVGSTGFATYSSPNALDFSSISDIKAYIASDFNSETYTLTLTRVTEAPAGEGLYIVGETGTYVIPETTTDAVYSNLLKGVTYPITISPTDGSYTNFILANGSHGVGFYTISTAGEIAVGKAYLQLPTASVSEVKAISVIFDDDDATSISLTPTLYKGERAIYNLQGQQVSQAKSGLYIINGKKVFIK